MADKEDGRYETDGTWSLHTSPLQSSAPLTIPKTASWKGITIEHHRQPGAECTLCLPTHTLCLLLSDCQTERKVNGGRLRRNHARRGEMIVYPATSEHWVRWQEPAEFLLLFLEPQQFVQTAEELATHSPVELMASEKERDDPLLLQIALMLKVELDEGLATSSSLYVDALINTLSAHLLRHYGAGAQLRQEPTNEHTASSLRSVMEYIHENLEKQLTLSELAQVAHMSPYHFARTFKYVVGIPPHRYLLQERVEQAKHLLLQGHLTGAEIASRLGFFDQSHFTRVFKQLAGVSPQTLLRQNSKNIPG